MIEAQERALVGIGRRSAGMPLRVVAQPSVLGDKYHLLLDLLSHGSDSHIVEVVLPASLPLQPQPASILYGLYLIGTPEILVKCRGC